MTMGLAFWVLMLIWLIGGIYYGYSNPPGHFIIGGNVVLFLLLLLLGWQTFGAPLH